MIKYSKMIVLIVILLNTIFAAATLYVFLRTSNEPTSLVVAWFAFTTGELWLLAGIKKTEVKKDVKISKELLEEFMKNNDEDLSGGV